MCRKTPHTHTHTHTRAHTHTHTHTHTNWHRDTGTHTHTHNHILTQGHRRTHLHTYTHAHTHINQMTRVVCSDFSDWWITSWVGWTQQIERCSVGSALAGSCDVIIPPQGVFISGSPHSLLSQPSLSTAFQLTVKTVIKYREDRHYGWEGIRMYKP